MLKPHLVRRRGVCYQGRSFVRSPCLESVLTLKNKAAGIFLLSLGCGAVAMSLGELRGAAWVGQALDLRVAVQLDEPVNSDSSCFDAEVLYGESQQSPARVRVSLDPSSQSAASTIRIQSLNPVNEPVVTVNLKAGCSAKTGRRYVLLADIPADQTGNTSGLASSALGINLPVVSAPVSIGLTGLAAAEPNSRGRTRSAALNKRSVAQASASRPDKPGKSTDRPAVRTPSRKSRLSLDPLEPLELRFERVQQEPSTQSTSIQLAVLPADPPVQGLAETQDALRFKKLEADVLSMQAQVVKSEQGMSQLRERLKQAEAERYDNGLVYALLAFLMAALAYLAYLLRRQAQAQSLISEAWFASAEATHDKPMRVVKSTPEPVVQTATVSRDEAVPSNNLSHVDLDNLIAFSDEVAAVPAFANTNTPPAEATLAIGNESPLEFNKPSIKTDPRQHADFLVSLGQSEQAIKILNSAIHEDEKINPMVYLDLLKIYHAMGMRDDYRLLSDRFTGLFKARVPGYAGFRNEGQDLTAYEEAIAQISLYWSTPQAIDVINTFIDADPIAESGARVDLQAFRDLLLLRAVAQSKLEAPQAEGRSGRQKKSVIWQG